MLRQACLLSFLLAAVAAGLEVCPGEGDRYADFKCDHDQTHRVCAKLLDGQGQPLSWGAGNFWQITGQEAFQWDEEIRQNHGDSWCICMWATATLIKEASCANVHIDCAATDVDYVMQHFSDGGVDLAPAKRCLEEKCKGAASAVQRLDDATIKVSPAVGSTGGAEERGPFAFSLLQGRAFGALLALFTLGGLFGALSFGDRLASGSSHGGDSAAQEAGQVGEAAIE